MGDEQGLAGGRPHHEALMGAVLVVVTEEARHPAGALHPFIVAAFVEGPAGLRARPALLPSFRRHAVRR
jgi:hypothetical protein